MHQISMRDESYTFDLPDFGSPTGPEYDLWLAVLQAGLLAAFHGEQEDVLWMLSTNYDRVGTYAWILREVFNFDDVQIIRKKITASRCYPLLRGLRGIGLERVHTKNRDGTKPARRLTPRSYRLRPPKTGQDSVLRQLTLELGSSGDSSTR